ncbi:MAG: hypothetical protein AAB582_00705 [Patescibacteria group bacterium]
MKNKSVSMERALARTTTKQTIVERIAAILDLRMPERSVREQRPHWAHLPPLTA